MRVQSDGIEGKLRVPAISLVIAPRVSNHTPIPVFLLDIWLVHTSRNVK